MIPVFSPYTNEKEIDYVLDALRRGEFSGSYGTYLDKFEKDFAEFCGCNYGVAVTSGTTALHLAVAAAEICKGDEVLISSSTNIATALGVVHNGAIPVPIDSESITWNLDLDLLEKAITSNTKAIIPVHLYGHPVDMDRLMDIAKKYKLLVIEDCAEAHGALVRGRKVGSFGDMACFSFYANKVITTGEGGMVVTNNLELANKLKLLRNLGFTQPRFKHEVLGYNYRMTGYQAAMGLAQLEKIDEIIDKKRALAFKYNKYLSKINGLTIPSEMPWAKNIYWMYAITVNEEKFGITRDKLMVELSNVGVETRTFFCPMNLQPALKNIISHKEVSCPVANSLWGTGMYLPSAPSLSEEDIMYICESIADIAKVHSK